MYIHMSMLTCRWTFISGPELGQQKWVTKSASFSCQDPLNSPRASAVRQLFVLHVFAYLFRGHRIRHTSKHIRSGGGGALHRSQIRFLTIAHTSIRVHTITHTHTHIHACNFFVRGGWGCVRSTWNRRCTYCAQIPLRATPFPLRVVPVI